MHLNYLNVSIPFFVCLHCATANDDAIFLTPATFCNKHSLRPVAIHQPVSCSTHPSSTSPVSVVFTHPHTAQGGLEHFPSGSQIVVLWGDCIGMREGRGH
ncbi:hypothetical protein ILYODFUR_006825 [Ilyodon furcidens]|uniref:Secreted protein n=1 Tax=Ilyodon furcidens TaxID=33524 RepID=A0ABV0V0X6_9TELE